MNTTSVKYFFVVCCFVLCSICQAAIGIRHSASFWANEGNIREEFIFDGQGADDVYEDLTITVDFVDKNGKTIKQGILEPFTVGNVDAYRFATSSITVPAEVINDTSYIRLVKATYTDSYGKRIRIPTSEFVYIDFMPIPLEW